MKVASKIATSSVLLMGLLLFALGYSLYTVKESERTARNLVRNKLDAARLTADSLSLVGQADDLAQRLLKVWPLLPDNLPNLVEELRTLNDGFRANLDKLRSLSLAATEDDQIKDLYILWRKHLQVLAPILETPPATPLGEAGLLSRELPESFQLLKSQLARLQTTLTQESNEDVRASTVTSSRARRVVILVTALALALSIYLMNFTIRSINAPLKRLITANDAVAQGNFDVRLDASTGDEFSRLAASFNSMVEHLSELDRMKRDFVAHVSHELRNPLVVLQETNQLLIDELAGPLTEKQRRMLALNIESGRRLSAMISNLLDLSSLEAGVMTYEFKQVDLSELVRAIATEFEGRLVERKLQMRLDLPPAPQIVVPCDRDRLIQVLENLIDNALKFSPAGGRVEVSLRMLAKLPKPLPAYLAGRLVNEGRGRSFALLSVADSGPGVPDNQKDLIFRKFHQAARASRSRGSGIGLGLAISSEIVGAHDGAIWVSDRRGGGSIFSVLLPGPSSLDAEGQRGPVPLLRGQEAAA